MTSKAKNNSDNNKGTAIIIDLAQSNASMYLMKVYDDANYSDCAMIQ